MKTITSSVGFQSPNGVLAANGYLLLSLQSPATLIAGGQLFSTIPIRIKLDSNAKIPAGTQIWASDEMSTQIPYTADLQDSNQSRLDTLGTWAIVGASPIDLSFMVSTNTGVSFPGAVLLAPSGNQTILTNNLILALGDFVTTVGNATIAGNGTFGGTLAVTGTITGTTKVTAGGTAGAGSVAGDMTASRSATSGALFLGTDGAQLLRSGDTITLSGTTKTHTFPNNTGTIAELNLAQTFTAAQTFSGTALGLKANFQVFTSSGTFTLPAGITAAKFTIVGAGGAGGGGSNAPINGGGGGSGGCGIKWLSSLTPGNTITITVGTGGTGVSAGAGNNGGDSSISSGTQSITTVTAKGGTGGGAAGAASQGGNGGVVGTNGDMNFAGTAGATTYSSVGGVGGPSIFGGAVNGGVGGAGSAGLSAGAGGSGGGNGGGNVAGGAGANGIVIVEWVT